MKRSYITEMIHGNNVKKTFKTELKKNIKLKNGTNIHIISLKAHFILGILKGTCILIVLQGMLRNLDRTDRIPIHYETFL